MQLMPVVIKVIENGGHRRHDIQVRSWDDLDTWLLENIKDPYQLLEAQSQTPFTAAKLHEYCMLGDEKLQLVLHVRVCGAGKDAKFSERAVNPSLMPLPRNVEVRVKGGNPCIKWKAPEGSPQDSAIQYQVRCHNGTFTTSGFQFEIPDSPPNVSCSASVAVLSHDGVGPEVTKLYAIERQDADFSSMARLVKPACDAFAYMRGHRQMRMLLVGKQHHGKSSWTNHLVRCFRQQMDIGDEVETGPPSEMETTVDVKALKIPFPDFHFTILDAPAFSSLTGENSKQLQALLESADGGWRRGDVTATSVCPWLINPPDAVLVIVSLQAWRHEYDELKEYLATLQGVLKHATQNDIALPYIVVATHKDIFMLEEGNAGKDPLEKLNEAIEDLKGLANTSNVYAVTNYQDDSLWMEPNTETTYRIIRDVTSLAKHVQADKVNLSKNSSAQRLLFCVIALVLLFVALCIGASQKK